MLRCRFYSLYIGNTLQKQLPLFFGGGKKRELGFWDKLHRTSGHLTRWIFHDFLTRRVCMNYVDVVVTLTSLVEVAFVALVLPMNPTLFRLLRIGTLGWFRTREFAFGVWSKCFLELQTTIF